MVAGAAWAEERPAKRPRTVQAQVHARRKAAEDEQTRRRVAEIGAGAVASGQWPQAHERLHDLHRRVRARLA